MEVCSDYRIVTTLWTPSHTKNAL